MISKRKMTSSCLDNYWLFMSVSFSLSLCLFLSVLCLFGFVSGFLSLCPFICLCSSVLVSFSVLSFSICLFASIFVFMSLSCLYLAYFYTLLSLSVFDSSFPCLTIPSLHLRVYQHLVLVILFCCSVRNKHIFCV